MRRFATLALALAAAAPAAGQPSPHLRSFFDGPAGFLLIEAEKAAWEKVASDEEAERFLALFWARRDPDLSTPENEFRQDFEQRVAAADKLFSYAGTRGALSARGKVLILLGMCDKRMDLEAGGKRGQDRFERFGPRGYAYVESGAVQIWEYQPHRFPSLKAREPIHVVFRERNPNAGDFELLIEKRVNMQTLRLLKEAPEGFIRHPDLTAPPAAAN